MLSSHTGFSEKHFYSKVILLRNVRFQAGIFVFVLVCDTACCQFARSFLLCEVKLATRVSAVQSEEQEARETTNNHLILQYLFRPLVVILT